MPKLPGRIVPFAVVLSLATPPASAAPPPDLTLVEVLTGLSSPLALRHAGDGSGRLFVVEQTGRILAWDGVAPPSVFLDLSTLVETSGFEQGLLGLDFHPDFAANRFFYVNYTRAGDGATVVARYRASAADPDVADPGSGTVILEVAQDFANHNGGNILFGPDGYLYVGMGDGGGGGDPLDRAQDPDTLLGKMLRLDVDGTPPAGPAELCGVNPGYGIPPGNPFAGAGDGCDEIWSLGLRNPWRFAFDRLAGDLFIGDVGQGTMEEVSVEPLASAGGRNYGWSCMEGTLAPNFNPCLPGPLVAPILTYLHEAGENDNCSVTGGYRYRGSRIGGLVGTYLYGDYCSGRIWFATFSGGAWSSTLWQETGIRITSFGEDEDGELYVVGDGGVYRLEAASAVFTDGFETGDASVWSRVRP